MGLRGSIAAEINERVIFEHCPHPWTIHLTSGHRPPPPKVNDGNLQAKASDKRAEDTYNDAAAVLHEALEIQKHLAAQDAVLAKLVLASG